MSDVMREPFPNHPPPITSRPEGLLSALGLQTNGRYPQHLAYDKLGAELDLLRWYMESQATFKTGTFAYTGAGNFVTDAGGNLTVPAGEHWYLLQFSARAQGLTGAGTGGALGRTNSSGTTLLQFGKAIVAGASENATLWADVNGYLGRPSVRLGVIQTVGAAGTVFDYTLRYVRLQT